LSWLKAGYWQASLNFFGDVPPAFHRNLSATELQDRFFDGVERIAPAKRLATAQGPAQWSGGLPTKRVSQFFSPIPTRWDWRGELGP